jgi:hypothetical protein
MKSKFLLIAFAYLSFIACEDKNEPVPPTPTPPLITLPDAWKKDSLLSLNMPNTCGVYVYAQPTMKAFAFVFDMKDTTLQLKTAMNKSRLTPSAWYQAEQGNVLALINAGFFDLTNGQSYSLVVNDNTMLSPNVKALTRPYNGVNTTYYPTRCAFGIENKKASFGWIYNVSATNNYIYPSPSPNKLNNAPAEKPSETFPANGKIWTPTVAIGGAPMLIYNNEIKISDAEELIDVNNNSGRSRSAIGVTNGNKCIILAIEKSSNSIGATLAETATLLKNMGCTQAINLDGGGSTCLLVNKNQSTNTPEGTTQRAVTSVLMIKKR